MSDAKQAVSAGRDGGSRPARVAGPKCEALEERQMLSTVAQPTWDGGFTGHHGARFAHFSTTNGAVKAQGFPSHGDLEGLGGPLGGLAGLGGPGLGGPGFMGHDALTGTPGTAPAGGKLGFEAHGAGHHFKPGGTFTPPALPAAVTTAMQNLQNAIKAAVPSLQTTPSAASLQQLQTDMKAIHAGTLTGTAATAKIQADQDAILVSKGFTTAQVTAIDAAQATLQADEKAIHGGTLIGTAATTRVQTDRDNLLIAAGASTSQVATIDAAQAALDAALKAANLTPPKGGPHGGAHTGGTWTV